MVKILEFHKMYGIVACFDNSIEKERGSSLQVHLGSIVWMPIDMVGVLLNIQTYQLSRYGWDWVKITAEWRHMSKLLGLED